MSRYARTYDCEDCGKRTTRVRGTVQPLICLDCTINRSVTAAREMAEHRGTTYDRWQKRPGPRGRPG